jgi:hypothetical protein
MTVTQSASGLVFWPSRAAGFAGSGCGEKRCQRPHLLMAASLWFVAVLAWNQLGPSSFFLSLGRRNRTKIALVFAFGWFFQLFTFGWLAPLAIGMYRIALRQ